MGIFVEGSTEARAEFPAGVPRRSSPGSRHGRPTCASRRWRHPPPARPTQQLWVAGRGQTGGVKVMSGLTRDIAAQGRRTPGGCHPGKMVPDAGGLVPIVGNIPIVRNVPTELKSTRPPTVGVRVGPIALDVQSSGSTPGRDRRPRRPSPTPRPTYDRSGPDAGSAEADPWVGVAQRATPSATADSSPAAPEPSGRLSVADVQCPSSSSSPACQRLVAGTTVAGTAKSREMGACETARRRRHFARAPSTEIGVRSAGARPGGSDPVSGQRHDHREQISSFCMCGRRSSASSVDVRAHVGRARGGARRGRS